MDWLKKHKYIIAIIITTIVLPLLLDKFIFGNTYISKVSNDGWASFLGSYIGSIIGAISSIIVVLYNISHNEQIRKEDIAQQEQIRKEKLMQHIRPYLYIPHYYSNDLSSWYITIKNAGLQAACDISIRDNDQDDLSPPTLHAKHLTLGANESSTITVPLDLCKSEYYLFSMYDVNGNRYTQELRITTEDSSYPQEIVSMNTLPPVLDLYHQKYF